jgi:DNA/RNA endonuclease YhcR with UshA esterase domain
MPILKIKQDGSWVEVWGAIDNNTSNDFFPKCTSITLLADSWVGDSQPYSQSVEINSTTINSKIDLQPTAQQIVDLQYIETSLMVQNNGDGTFTAWAIGSKPTSDYTMQVLITEVTPV